MDSSGFNQGVRPGGLTSGTEVRILLCYLLDSTEFPLSRRQIEDVLLGEELVNYFVLAESLAQLEQQRLVTGADSVFRITAEGRMVARALARDVPKTVREAAIRGVIRAQQWAAREKVHKSEIISNSASGNRLVRCSIGDDAGPLFGMELYMPDDLTAEAVRNAFVANGDAVYKLVLAATTHNKQMANDALDALIGRDTQEGNADKN